MNQDKENLNTFHKQPHLTVHSPSLQEKKLKKLQSYSTQASSFRSFSEDSKLNSQNFIQNSFKTLDSEGVLERQNVQLLERQKIQNYQLNQVIGSGTFGVVHKGIYLPEMREIAIKVIEFSNFQGFYLREVKNFCKRQIQISSKIKSSHFLPLTFAVILNEQFCYIIMEYYLGFSMSTLIDLKISISSETLQYYLASLLLGIEQCHKELKVIHRDIKPGNIMILHNVNYFLKKGTIRLLDFGCSRFLQPHERAKSLVGTSEYFSPQTFKQNYSHHSDIWAFAVVAYELLMGELPFSCPSNVYNEEDKFCILSKKLKKRSKISIKTENKNLAAIIQGIINSEEKERMENWSIEKIKQSTYFEEIDWEKLRQGKLQPPIQFSLEEVINYNTISHQSFHDF